MATMAILAPHQPTSLIDWNKTSPVFKICLSAMLTVLLIIGDLSFSFIPFVQVITFLIILYFFILGYRQTLLILSLYVFIDCMISGGMWPIFISVPMMFCAWFTLPTLLLLTRLLKCSVYKKLWLIAIIAGLHGFLFGQTFAIGNTLVYYSTATWKEFVRGWQLWVMADIPWEIAQCVVGILSALILFPVVYSVLRVVLKRYSYNESVEDLTKIRRSDDD